MHHFESQNDVRTEVNSVFQKLGIPQFLKIDHHMDLLDVLLQGHVLYCYCFFRDILTDIEITIGKQSFYSVS